MAWTGRSWHGGSLQGQRAWWQNGSGGGSGSWQGARGSTATGSSGVGVCAPRRGQTDPATKLETSGWSAKEGGWKHNPLPNSQIIQLRDAPDLVDMIATRDNISREEARLKYEEWKNALAAEYDVKLTIRDRASTGGQRRLKEGQPSPKITVYGSEGVQAAFGVILDLLDDGGFDTSTMDLPRVYRGRMLLDLDEAQVT